MKTFEVTFFGNGVTYIVQADNEEEAIRKLREKGKKGECEASELLFEDGVAKLQSGGR